MGFNFGAFLGGMGRGISETMDANQLQSDKLELIGEEAATRERLARSAERRAKRQEDE